jgi:hypothetical protein
MHIYSVFADIVTRNCLFTAPGHNCMSHHPALTENGTKIIHTVVQLCVLSTGY